MCSKLIHIFLLLKFFCVRQMKTLQNLVKKKKKLLLLSHLSLSQSFCTVKKHLCFI